MGIFFKFSNGFACHFHSTWSAPRVFWWSREHGANSKFTVCYQIWQRYVDFQCLYIYSSVCGSFNLVKNPPSNFVATPPHTQKRGGGLTMMVNGMTGHISDGFLERIAHWRWTDERFWFNLNCWSLQAASRRSSTLIVNYTWMFFLGKRKREDGERREEKTEKFLEKTVHCLRQKGIYETPDVDEKVHLHSVNMGWALRSSNFRNHGTH